jgi:type IV secretory pathway VirJ component
MKRSTWMARGVGLGAAGLLVGLAGYLGSRWLDAKQRPVVPDGPAVEDTLRFGRFDLVHVYHTTDRPSHLVLFASGDGGWNQGVVTMARELSTMGSLVAGFDVVSYLKAVEADAERCAYPAADFEALGHYLEQRYAFSTFDAPVLVGYSSGATVVYAAAAQAPPNTFRGAISLGFCPDLPVRKPWCRGRSLEATPLSGAPGYRFAPAPDLITPWVALHGAIDQVCAPDTVAAFVRNTGNAEIVRLPEVGHGFGVVRNWMPQFRAAYARLIEQPIPETPVASTGLPGLPLVEVPATGGGDTLAVIVSGDGGWAGIDRSLAEVLARQGIPVVGIDALRYFWSRRTPDGASRDLARVIEHYLARWNKRRLIVIGYSFGADVLPFMVTRLPTDVRARIALVALISPQRYADFEFHMTDWLPTGGRKTPYAILPEVRRLAGTSLLCLYGADEHGTICPALDTTRFDVRMMPGGHHFGGEYERLAAVILGQR